MLSGATWCVCIVDYDSVRFHVGDLFLTLPPDTLKALPLTERSHKRRGGEKNQCRMYKYLFIENRMAIIMDFTIRHAIWLTPDPRIRCQTDNFAIYSYRVPVRLPGCWEAHCRYYFILSFQCANVTLLKCKRAGDMVGRHMLAHKGETVTRVQDTSFDFESCVLVVNANIAQNGKMRETCVSFRCKPDFRKFY